MSVVRLGQLNYINCLPIYHAIEEGLLPIEAELVKAPPSKLNALLLGGQLDLSPISSIEYARHKDDYLILPDLSVSADGQVMSILLFSKEPVTELDGKKVCLTESSATGTALMRILDDYYFQVEVSYKTAKPDLKSMLRRADGALLIGDPALSSHQLVLEQNLPFHVTDLGKIWKELTGMKMIYAIWVVRRDFARENPAVVAALSETLRRSKEIGLSQMPVVYEKARKRSGLPLPVLEAYYNCLDYRFDQESQKALLTFFDYAFKSGLVDERVKLRIWGEDDAGN